MVNCFFVKDDDKESLVNWDNVARIKKEGWNDAVIEFIGDNNSRIKVKDGYRDIILSLDEMQSKKND